MLERDVQAEIGRITVSIHEMLAKQLRRRCLVIGISGGIDSVVSVEQARHVRADIAAKRRATSCQHLAPLLIEPVGELRNFHHPAN